jgi:FkbM family methyltransferase
LCDQFGEKPKMNIAEDESFRIASSLVGRVDPVVIDGGAHLGDMVEKFRALLPRAEFHCLEPDPARAETLMRKFGSFPRVHVVQAALGDVVGKAKININVSRPTNSL